MVKKEESWVVNPLNSRSGEAEGRKPNEWFVRRVNGSGFLPVYTDVSLALCHPFLPLFSPLFSVLAWTFPDGWQPKEDPNPLTPPPPHLPPSSSSSLLSSRSRSRWDFPFVQKVKGSKHTLVSKVEGNSTVRPPLPPSSFHSPLSHLIPSHDLQSDILPLVPHPSLIPSTSRGKKIIP